MSTLPEFLLARVAEDEAVAERASHWWDTDQEAGYFEWPSQEAAEHVLRHDPARVLAECDAKRRISTEVHYRAGDGPSGEWLSDWQKDACEGCGWSGPCDDYVVEHINDCPTLRILALPYAHHPDYDEAWRL